MLLVWSRKPKMNSEGSVGVEQQRE
uniref:Uncharacterized protein n=1 Tax=Arundo donax TaxID=35708 RepID=A0A0A9FST0_ARUDO